jgi:hypothetical protein
MLIYKDILENKIEKNEYSKKEIKFFNKIIVIEEEMYQIVRFKYHENDKFSMLLQGYEDKKNIFEEIYPIEMLDRMTFFDLNY